MFQKPAMNSIKRNISGDEIRSSTNTGDVISVKSKSSGDVDGIKSKAGGSNELNQGELSAEHTEPSTTKATTMQPAPSPPRSPQSSPPPPSVANGVHKGYPRQVNTNTFGRSAQEITNQIAPHVNTSQGVSGGGEPHQQTYSGDSGYGRNGKRLRQSSFGSDGGGGGGGGDGGGHPQAPPKGQRVCQFYESGRCKKGASCNFWHP